MTLVMIQEETVHIPEWVTDLASFRRWAKSDDFPQRGWYAHLNGQLWVDPSMERLGHNQIKSEVGRVVGGIVKGGLGGRFLGDRMLLTNADVGLSTEPDGMYLSSERAAERAFAGHAGG
jgi:hypothetical protein